MRKIFVVLVLTGLLTSCINNYKICNCNSENEKIKIYNEILNELVEQHFYSKYLNIDEEIDEFYSKNISNPEQFKKNYKKFERERIKLHNKLYEDSSKCCNLYLDTLTQPSFEKWIYYQNVTDLFDVKLKNIITELSENGQYVLDSLNSNMEMNLSDFHLCSSRLVYSNERNWQNDKCEIGTVSLSKVFINKNKTKGIMYYTFHCGFNCGRGEVIVIEKIKNRWTIIDAIMTWIS